jgi:hypothetical protein
MKGHCRIHTLLHALHFKKDSINVWCEIVDDYITGPYVHDIKWSQRNQVCCFPWKNTSLLLVFLPHNIINSMQHWNDGATAHCSPQVCNWLNNHFLSMWTRHEFQSPDLLVLLISIYLILIYGNVSKKCLCYEIQDHKWQHDQSHPGNCNTLSRVGNVTRRISSLCQECSHYLLFFASTITLHNYTTCALCSSVLAN